MTKITVRQLPRHRGVSGWTAILPAPAMAPVLSGRAQADIAIIGGGFAGLAAARRLTLLDPALSVALLEAGAIAEGAAGRNSGFMIDLPHNLTSEDYAGSEATPDGDRTLIAMNRQAIGFARDAAEDFGIDPAFFDPAGKVNGAASTRAEAHNASYARHLDSLGEPYEVLDAKGMKALTGSGHYRSGLFTPGTVMLQPAGFVRGMAAGLAHTIALYERSPVTALTRAGSAWRIETPGGTLDAERVILATNGHLESFGFASGRLMHVFLFASMTPELDAAALSRLGGAERWGITPSDPMGTSMRRISTAQGGNRILIRTCAVLRSGLRVGAADLARATALQRRKFDDRFPQLAGLAPEFEWAGHLCLSRNGVSVTRELEPGLFSAAVQNGLGTTRGTLTGMAAADMALGLDSPLARHFGTEAAPTRLPPKALRDAAANAYLRWQEWKARTE